MIRVLVNGQERELSDDGTLAGLMRSLDVAPDRGGVAVAVDGEVVPRRGWPGTQLRDGARVEIVVAVQGG